MKLEEAIKKYGPIELTFDNYYKYTFYFKGLFMGKSKSDFREIIAWFGGDADDIYRMEVSKNDIRYLNQIDEIDGFQILDINKKEIMHWSRD